MGTDNAADLDNALGTPAAAAGAEVVVDPNGPEALKAAEAQKAKQDAEAKAKADTPEGKAAAAKKLEDDAAAKKVADDKLAAEKAAKVEVKFGDLQVDAKIAGRFAEVAKELGLDSAKAQKVADIYVEAKKSEDAAIAQALQQQSKKWGEANRADKEIGGANYGESVLSAKKVLTKFGPEFQKTIDAYGLGNEPSLLKMLARIGKADREDKLKGGGDGAGGELTEDQKLAARYPVANAQRAKRSA